MSKQSLYRLEVAPLTILPLSRSPFFTYASTAPIAKGSLVSISFGTQTLEGIVFECQALPGAKPMWMKHISHVIEPSFLTDEQCDLAVMVSREYFTPLGKTLRHFLPKTTRERKSRIQKRSEKEPMPRPTKEEKIFLEKFAFSQQPSSIDTSYLTDPKKFWAFIAKYTQKEKQQLLILVPEITLVFPLQERLERHFGESVVTLHSRLSSGAFFTSWERIRSGEAQIIVATRQGLFAPFHDLGAIIVTEEQDDSYKQWDMSPRYHGKRVAAMLAPLHQAKILFASGTPSTETILQRENQQCLSLSPIMTHPPLGDALTIVNLKLERYRRNFSPLSEALVQSLQATLDRGAQALLYINRQGMNAFSVCEHCKNTFRCPKCEHPLSSTREGSFRCAACGFVTTLFPSCPSCGHLSFRHIGFGTEKVEREVCKLFPKARVVRLDSGAIKKAGMIEKMTTDGMENKIDILIGTQMILKDPPLPKLALIAMIDADSLLLFPDFRSDERLFQDVSRAVRQGAKNFKTTGTTSVLLQTFHPESAFLQKITTLSSVEFLSLLLTDRKVLSYPPYTRLITLVCRGETAEEVRKKEARIVAALKKTLPETYRLRSPLHVRFLKKQNRFESDILLRFPDTGKPLPEEVSAALIRASEDCIIDADPVSQR